MEIMDEERQVIVLSETVLIGDKILASLQITLILEDAPSSPERTIRIIDTEEEARYLPGIIKAR